jgi:hypothetical protein
MQTQDFEQLTRREWRALLRWRAWQAQMELDQAIAARRKAIADYQMEEGATLENWTNLRRALRTESDARQKYNQARSAYERYPSSPHSAPKDVTLAKPL